MSTFVPAANAKKCVAIVFFGALPRPFHKSAHSGEAEIAASLFAGIDLFECVRACVRACAHGMTS